ncbi:MAG: MBL fold metallo-hydrolase [Akkermansia sp.]|nr:MBL fold metallo-hydrolase [Akkermansia sp.]
MKKSSPTTCSRRRFLKFLAGGIAGLTTAGWGVDRLLAHTLCRPGEWHGPVTDHFDGTRFFNPTVSLDYSTSAAVRWLSERGSKGHYPTVDQNKFTPQLAPEVIGTAWEITMVNHSTMLIRCAGLNILTDPIWSDYTSPVPLGPERKRPVGIPWDELPKIDVCLLSHDHYDHFDVPTLQRLYTRDNPLFIVPLGLRSLLAYHLAAEPRCEEKDWWESVQVSPQLRIVLTPALHWSKRYRDEASANRSLWCGFSLLVENGPHIYFAGDTARCNWFPEIRRRLGAPTVALLPIGQYKPEWIRKNHTNPADAVEAFIQLQAGQAIACHFGTWQLANEGYDETLSDLACALTAANIPPERFLAPENGQSIRSTP